MMQRSLVVLIFIVVCLSAISLKGKDRDDRGSSKSDNSNKNNDRGNYSMDDKGRKNNVDERKSMYDSKEYLSFCIDITDNSTKVVRDMIKGIKKKANKNEIYENLKTIKGHFEELNNETDALFKQLTELEKNLVKEQEINIKIIQKRIDEMITRCENDLNKTSLNHEELYNNAKKIDNEIDKINRQYRAMQWILVNEQ
jgi:hypothetical protein